MKKPISSFLALLLALAVLFLQTGCSKTDDTAETEGPRTIFVPDPVSQTKSTDLGTPLADVRVRRALAHAIDMDTVIEALFYDNAHRATTFAAPGDWLNTGIETCEYDPDKAKALLADAGWPSGYVLDVVYWEDDQLTEDFLDVIGNYWEAVGVKAEFRKLEGDLTKQLWKAPSDPEDDSAVVWDLAYGSVAALTELEYYSRFASDASNNSHTPPIEGLDELIRQAQTAGEEQERKELVAQIQQVLAENVSFIPLYDQNCFVCISDHLDTAGTDFGNDHFVYDKNILNWTTDREDNTLYTDGGPESYFQTPLANPGQYLYQELVFERLLKADSDLNPADGQIAEDYTVSDDGMTVEFTIREGLLWHDGEPLTAEDVKFTFELYMQCTDADPLLGRVLDALSGAAEFTDGKAEECTGIVIRENRVSFCFEESAPDALRVFSQWPVLPKHALEDVNPAKLQQNAFWKNPIGSGPYRVSQVELGKYCILERWDGYRETGEGNIEFIHMTSSDAHNSDLAVYAAMDLIDYGWGSSTDDEVYISQLEGMTVAQVKNHHVCCFFINQYPHESYIAQQNAEEETTAPTE